MIDFYGQIIESCRFLLFSELTISLLEYLKTYILYATHIAETHKRYVIKSIIWKHTIYSIRNLKEHILFTYL